MPPRYLTNITKKSKYQFEKQQPNNSQHFSRLEVGSYDLSNFLQSNYFLSYLWIGKYIPFTAPFVSINIFQCLIARYLLQL